MHEISPPLVVVFGFSNCILNTGWRSLFISLSWNTYDKFTLSSFPQPLVDFRKNDIEELFSPSPMEEYLAEFFGYCKESEENLGTSLSFSTS